MADTRNAEVVPIDASTTAKADSTHPVLTAPLITTNIESSHQSPEATDDDAVTSSSTPVNLRLTLLMASLFCGTFVMALDATLIGTVVPIISSDFDALDDIAWYGSGYLVTLTALQPTFGKLYRLANVKLVFMVCIVIFEVGSIMCAAAPSSAVFIGGRAIAGAGAAGLFQGALVIITRSVALQRRPLCISIVTSAFAVAVCIGPPIGGAFADSISWRWAFWINVPIGAVVLVLVLFLLRLPKDEPQGGKVKSTTILQKLWKLDPIGASLIIAAVVCLLLALQWGGQSKAWNSATVIGLLVAAPLMLGLFVWTQWKLGNDATLPLWVFRQRSLLAGGLYSMFFAMPTYVYGYYIPIYFQAVRSSSVLQSGVQFLALAIPQMFGVVLSGALVTMIGVYSPFMVFGTAVGLLGSGLFLKLDLDTSKALWAVYLVICGIGTGFAINLPYTVVQAILTEDEVPTGNAAFQFMFQLGAAISLSIAQPIFLNELKASAQTLTPSIPYDLIMSAGPNNIHHLAPTQQLFDSLRQVYMHALRNTYIFPIAAGAAALLATFALEQKNLKKIEAERKALAEAKDETSIKDEEKKTPEQAEVV